MKDNASVGCMYFPLRPRTLPALMWSAGIGYDRDPVGLGSLQGGMGRNGGIALPTSGGIDTETGSQVRRGKRELVLKMF